MKWQVLQWDDISQTVLHQIFALRSEVFVVEQNCVYQDIDGEDPKATHVLGYESDILNAYSSLFKPSINFTQANFDRAVIKHTHRQKGYGYALISQTLEAMGDCGEIKISAQHHLQTFYSKHGFDPVGEPYLEDGIPHIAMIKPSSTNEEGLS